MKELLERIIETKTSSNLWLEGKKIQPSFEKLVEKKRETIIAVDGGSASILETTSMHVLFVRIIAVQLEPRKIKEKEGFLVVSVQEDAELLVEFFDSEKKELFRTKDVDLHEAAGLGRKILEWQVADACEGIVVWDGSFTTKYEFEKKYLPRAIALAKSTTAVGSWNIFSQEAPWLAKSEEISFVKLAEKGKVFRVENRGSIDDLQVYSLLVPWAQDPVFIGYPYPLILADQLARVSNDERSALKIRLKAIAGSRWEKISQGIQDSHDILDSIQF